MVYTPNSFTLIAAMMQLLLLIGYALFTTYTHSAEGPTILAPNTVSDVEHFYPMYQDVHVMIFIGFGFLMTFLKKYGFSAVGFNFVLSALMVQWSILVVGFWHRVHSGDWHQKITIGIPQLIPADFAAGSVMIAFGAVLGKTTPTQLLVMGSIQMVFFGLNEMIGVLVLKVADMGGSMIVHAFGAYFGVGVALGINSRNHVEDHVEKADATSDKTSDTFAMIGTIFLWMFWPSFNGAMAGGASQHRVVVNTVLSLAACCSSAFAGSVLFRGGKFSMVDVQNATLAGGVAVGTAADMVLEPWGAILAGSIAGWISVLGYCYVQPFLQRKLGLHDTCGVHNLHGMPGLFGALVGVIAARVASTSNYGANLYTVFPARTPANHTEAALLQLEAGNGRSASDQAWLQLAFAFITFAISILSGLATGAFLGSPVFDQPRDYFDDEEKWELEADHTAGAMFREELEALREEARQNAEKVKELQMEMSVMKSASGVYGSGVFDPNPDFGMGASPIKQQNDDSIVPTNQPAANNDDN